MWLRTLVSSAAVLLVAAVTTGFGEVPPPDDDTVGAELDCSLCLEYEGQHIFPNGSDDPFCDPEVGSNEDCAACGGESECHDDWDEGGCHLDCEDQMEEQDLDDLLAAWERRDLRSTAALIAANGDQVELNGARSAVQIRGCGSAVAWHLPISAEDLSALEVLVDKVPAVAD